ncbi:MAG: DUF1648 domain-containing protein [Intestinibacter sp.]|uniref:DUF1648 domain-containing protein n=1 Tax=Intestinibacter sp. TaxID=1965304 RepID=UPI0025C0B4F9|nr:DUF1648 domain-containing protein [Intestinibacter sp.]MCI6738811.1 DUF1648 domain-containing protein [Intestinibacter sp.]
MDFKDKKLVLKKIIYYFIGFLPLIVTFFVYPNIPEQIPSHYSTIGEVAKWGNKGEVLVIPFLLAVFTYAKPRVFKDEFETDIEDKVSDFATLLFIVSVNLLCYLELYTSLKGVDSKTVFNFYNLISCVICFVFIFLGYVFLNCDRDSSVSIKIPNYLMNNTIWKNLHHNLGSYWLSSSIVCLPIGILCGNTYILYLLIAEILFIMLIPIIIILYYIRKYRKN